MPVPLCRIRDLGGEQVRQFGAPFSVTDTGIGIHPEALESLFKPFSQVAAPARIPVRHMWITLNSPMSVKHLGVGKAEIKDADGLKLITHYLDANNAYTTGFLGSPTSAVGNNQYYPIEGQKAVVTDAKGFKTTFYFVANG